MVLLLLTFVMVIAVAVFTGPQEANQDGVEVVDTTYGDQWPFPQFERGVIRCENRRFDGITRPLITIELNAKMYGLNGAALGVGGFPDSRVFLERDQFGAYQLGALDEFIQTGLGLCEN